MKEFDRLVEISPDIPTSVIKDFRSQYKHSDDLIKPEIADKILSSKVYEIKEKAIDYISPIIEVPSEIELIKKEFIDKFSGKHKRHPTEQEIQDYMELRTITTDSTI